MEKMYAACQYAGAGWLLAQFPSDLYIKYVRLCWSVNKGTQKKLHTLGTHFDIDSQSAINCVWWVFHPSSTVHTGETPPIDHLPSPFASLPFAAASQLPRPHMIRRKIRRKSCKPIVCSWMGFSIILWRWTGGVLDGKALKNAKRSVFFITLHKKTSLLVKRSTTFLPEPASIIRRLVPCFPFSFEKPSNRTGRFHRAVSSHTLVRHAASAAVSSLIWQPNTHRTSLRWQKVL